MLARGFPGRRNYWTFVFESDRSLWLLEDTARYRPASQVEAPAFESRGAQLPAVSGNAALTRPVNVRAALGTTVVRWVWRDAAWQEEPAARVAIPGEACYSLAGRDEGRATGWVVYTTSRTTLYRLVTVTRTLTELRRAPAGSAYRGVVLPPLRRRGGAAPILHHAPMSLSSLDAPPAGEAPPAATRSKTRKPRAA